MPNGWSLVQADEFYSKVPGPARRKHMTIPVHLHSGFQFLLEWFLLNTWMGIHLIAPPPPKAVHHMSTFIQ